MGSVLTVNKWTSRHTYITGFLITEHYYFPSIFGSTGQNDVPLPMSAPGCPQRPQCSCPFPGTSLSPPPLPSTAQDPSTAHRAISACPERPQDPTTATAPSPGLGLSPTPLSGYDSDTHLQLTSN